MWRSTCSRGAEKGSSCAGKSPAEPKITVIEGDVAPDPSKALAAATKAFERAGDTLTAINEAAAGLVKITKSSDNLDKLLTTWNGTGQDVTGAAQSIRRFIDANEGDFKPTIASIRQVAAKLDKTLDDETQKALQSGINRFSNAVARIDAGLADLQPALKDLGANVKDSPTTDIGQTIRRLNLIFTDVELLTSKLRDRNGRLNTEGTLQKLIVKSELYDNLNQMALSAKQALLQLKSVLASLRTFADKVSSDPGSLTRGALQR